MISAFEAQYYQISLILILAAFAIPISRKAAIADIPILIILGIIFGPVLEIINHTFASNFLTQFGEIGIGLLGIMIILYYESHHMNFRVIRRHFFKIASLDTIGVIITALVAGSIFSLIFRNRFRMMTVKPTNMPMSDGIAICIMKYTTEPKAKPSLVTMPEKEDM